MKAAATARGRSTLDDVVNGRPRGVMTCAANVQATPIKWLWPGRIALGKPTLIAGDPGLGKSLISVALAMHVTTGARWPVDNTPCPKGKCIFLSAEDDLADTIRPRLDAAGADPRMVFHLGSVREFDTRSGEVLPRSFSLKRDIRVLADALTEHPECRMVVIDPISAYLDGTDSHNNSDVRSVLAPLSELASTHGVAVVAVTHLNKGATGSAMYRATGSLAFIAAARAAYAVVKDQDDPGRRLFLPVKNNLGPDRTGLAYRVREADNGAPVIDWEPDAVSVTADDALLRVPDEIRSERDEARDWLRDMLRQGAVPAKEILKDAEQCGISKRTLDRAKRDLGVLAEKGDFKGGWQWKLPAEGCQGEGSHLCGHNVATLAENKQGRGVGDLHDIEDRQYEVAGNLGIGPHISPEALTKRRQLRQALGPACAGLFVTPRQVAAKLPEIDYDDIIACPKTARTFAESVGFGVYK